MNTRKEIEITQKCVFRLLDILEEVLSLSDTFLNITLHSVYLSRSNLS